MCVCVCVCACYQRENKPEDNVVPDLIESYDEENSSHEKNEEFDESEKQNGARGGRYGGEG